MPRVPRLRHHFVPEHPTVAEGDGPRGERHDVGLVCDEDDRGVELVAELRQSGHLDEYVVIFFAKPGWTIPGLAGSYQENTKEEEMGARSMPLASALAYLPDDPAAPQWREWLTRWTTNIAGHGHRLDMFIVKVPKDTLVNAHH